MLIERAEFQTTEKAERQRFEFKAGSLNLFSTDEDRAKSDLFSAISLVLWGKDERVDGVDADAGDLKEGSISLNVNGKKLELSRDFVSNDLKLQSEQGAEPGGAKDLLAGISKDLFNTLFLVGQDEGGSGQLADKSKRLSLLGQFASLSEKNSNIDKAVRLVEEKLEKYPFRAKTYKIDDLIAGLSRGKVVLEERLVQLERERQAASEQIDELKLLEESLERARRTRKREEYFQLCLETAELDARIMKVQQRMLHEAEIKKELQSLGDLSYFPISAQRKVQELGAMRSSRLGDLERLDQEIAEGEKEAKLIADTFNGETPGLEKFSLEESQQLFSLASSLNTAQEELEQLTAQRSQEMRRVKDSGVDFDSISLIRKAILAMEPADVEEATQISGELKWQKEKLSSLVALSQKTGGQLKVLSEEISRFNQKSRKIKTILIGLTSVSGLAALALLVSQNAQTVIFSTIAITSFVLSLIALLAFPPILSGLRKDLELKFEEISEQQKKFDANELELSGTVSEIQKRGDQIAKIYKFSSAAELFKKLQSYSGFSATLKQLDVLDHVLANCETQINNLNKEASTYFDRVGVSPIIMTQAAITGLASEILRHKEHSRGMERGTAILNHRKTEKRFMEDEIADIDDVLKDYFKKAKLSDLSNVDAALEEFDQKAQSFRKWESLSLELKRMEKDLTSEILEHDLSTVLYKLQHRRTDAWTTMQDLISRYPEILTETIEDAEIGRLTQGEARTAEDDLLEKAARAEALRADIRAVAKNFDEFHPRTQNELEILERDLDMIKHNKAALSLAKDSLVRVAQESKSSWSQELAEISNEMLADSELEVKKIEWDENMDMILTINKQEEPIHENALQKIAAKGLLKQINWMTRLTLCRYIAKRMPLPVVLDEPFCDLDDKRFAACMNLLLNKLLPHCQLIVLTCQRVRHQWFVDKLADADKEKVKFI